MCGGCLVPGQDLAKWEEAETGWAEQDDGVWCLLTAFGARLYCMGRGVRGYRFLGAAIEFSAASGPRKRLDGRAGDWCF